MPRNAHLVALAAILSACVLSAGVELRAADEVQLVKTPTGVSFARVGQKGEQPAPTLFVFASTARDSLTSDDFFKSGRLLRQKDWLCVSLDVPCHGEDVRPNEPAGLNGWRARLEKQENFLAPFVERCRAVLDYLVSEGYSDPQQVAVAGTSRGGFCAFHLAAGEPRVKWVVAFAPVTELPVVNEFKGLESDALTKSLAATNLAANLVGKSAWLCIGNHDARVGTGECFSFVRAVAQANLAVHKPASIELHVMPSEGHRIHDTAHDEAAAWLLRQAK